MNGYHLEKIWDPVTRLWHWALALSVCAGWGMGKFMTFSTIEWHFYCGYCTGGLLIFRCIWGFFGPAPIRFKRLIPSVSSTISYLKKMGGRTPSGSPGHNPVGSLSVIAMILLLGTQATTGLFVESDDFFEYGPLVAYVSSDVVGSMTWIHRLVADGILIIVVLHVSAIVFYLCWKKENLIKPMMTGWKWVKDLR
ncbi:MAG: cytochrome b [Gammaproteobacteria bacterium]